jgi:glycosyltransferase involved in cell wall biosynthesis
MAPRNRIVLVFDEHYTSNGNAVFAAAKHLIGQMGAGTDYQLFCRGRYRGPRLASRSAKIRIADPQFPPGRRREFVRRILGRLKLADAPNRSLSNIAVTDRKLVRWLFQADRINAVIVFTLDPNYALQIARLAHIFSGPLTPHLIAVTPETDVLPETAQDLSWLGVRVLKDGNAVAGRPRRLRKATPTRLMQLAAARRGSGQESADTIAARFDEARPLSFLDPASYPYQLVEPASTVFWPTWIGQEQPLPVRVRDIVLFFRPDWVSCGSGTLFQSLAAYFRKHDSLLIDIGIWPFVVPFKPEEGARQVREQQRYIRSAAYFGLRRSSSVFYTVRQLPKLLAFPPWTIVHQVLLQYALAAKPSLLRQIVKHARITHIYLNHYFTYLFAEEFIANRKFFLDTHDIQAINFVHAAARNLISRRGEDFNLLLKNEMDIARRAARISFVSKTEMEMAATQLPRERLDFIIPLPEIAPSPPKPLITPARLLIIASRNPLNEQSVTWFLNQVWPRILDGCADAAPGSDPSASVQLEICGDINTLIKDPRLPGVRFRGIVDDLGVHYQQCDIVLLPVIMGGGVAVKTLEALLHERAVVATRHALRGLPEEIVDAVGYVNEPDAFANAVIELLRSATARDESIQRTRRAVQLLREQRFYERLSAAMVAVRLDPSTQAILAPHSEPVPGLNPDLVHKP